MSDLIKSIHDYQHLLGHGTRLRRPLDEPSARRLSELQQLLETSPGEDWPAPEGSTRRRWPRLDVSLPAMVEVGEYSASVTISDIGGGGLCIEPAPRLRPGERTVVTVADSRGRRAYLFPAQVAWRSDGAVGLEFVGVPREFTVAAPR